MRNWFLRNGAMKRDAYLEFTFIALGIALLFAFTAGFIGLAIGGVLVAAETGNPIWACLALPLASEVFVASVLLYLRRVRNAYERADDATKKRMRDEAGIT